MTVGSWSRVGSRSGYRYYQTAAATVLALFALSGTPAVAADGLDGDVILDIPAQPLPQALVQFGRQARVQMMLAPNSGDSQRSKELRGTFPARMALSTLLRDSGLSFQAKDNTVTVAPTTLGAAERHPFRLAQERTPSERSIGTQTNGPPPSGSDESSSESGKGRPATLEEVVVTGSNIRGVSPASPMVVLDEVDFERGGYASVAEVMQSLPQNFSGGLNPATANFSPNPQAASNVGLTTTANLHGLGSEATLTLLNGHRMTGSGETSAVDISAIPLSAVQRVEVLTDGASALYGSDAVAGVVNFVLRQDFNGLDATAQYGVATQGSAQENRGALVYGSNWNSGNIITTYEHYGQAALPSSERSFSSGVQQPTDLLPADRRDSVLLHLKQDVSRQSDLYLDALYSRNRKVDALTFGTTTYIIDTLSVAPGAEFTLGGGWVGSVAGLYGRNHDHQQLIKPSGQTGSAGWHDTLGSAELKVDGPLFEAPGGLSKLAIGAGWRSESFAVPEQNVQRATRSIKDIFAELNIPLLQSSGKDTLTVNVAGRYERYSDFGQSTNPKLGLSWYPLSTLKIRGTWGTSFRAPTLFSEYNPGFAYVFREPDPKSPTGSTVTLARLGGNPQLGPEKSTTFTVGADYDSTTLPGLRTSVTYFNTDYRDRIGLVNGNPYTYLSNEGLYPPPYLIRNPGVPFVRGVLQSVGPDNVYSLVGAFNPADIAAYQDDRQVNSASYRQDGLDLNARYNASTGIGNLLSQVNAVYLFKIDQRITATGPAVNLVNTVFYPVGIRFRASQDWSVGGWGSSVALNFTNRYENNTVTPGQAVKAYATVDARTSYAFEGDTSRSLAGLVLSVAVRNAFDTKPPLVHSPDFSEQPINYDPANADPIGRFITLQITKHW